jgi:membrane fusion protein (multidrug efflux system)
MKLNKKSFLGLILTASALLSQSVSAAGGPQMPARTVGYKVMSTQSVPIITEQPGRTIASYTSEVRPQVTGIITQVLFQEGSNVEKGQALYQIDPAQYQATLDSAKASLLSAEANLVDATATFKRYENLYKKKVTSKSEFDTRRAAYLSAKAQVKQAQASVKTAQINLNYTTIRSSISGRIGRSSYTVGALVTANQATPIATVQAFDPMHVDLTSSANSLLAFRRAVQNGTYSIDKKKNDGVELLFEDGTPYSVKGDFLFADTNVDTTTGSFITRVSFPNPDNVLLPGLFVRAKLSLGTINNAITVPLVAVMRTAKGEAYVYVLGEGNKVKSRPVTPGSMTAQDWVILDGLKSGEKVIVSGMQFVRPGAPVTNPIDMTNDQDSKATADK